MNIKWKREFFCPFSGVHLTIKPRYLYSLYLLVEGIVSCIFHLCSSLCKWNRKDLFHFVDLNYKNSILIAFWAIPVNVISLKGLLILYPFPYLIYIYAFLFTKSKKSVPRHIRLAPLCIGEYCSITACLCWELDACVVISALTFTITNNT